jgi:hypothetical protein
MVMDEIMRSVTEGQDSGLPNLMVHADDIVIWEPNENTIKSEWLLQCVKILD